MALLTGCSAGFGATAIQDYAPADGVIATSGDIRVLNALVVESDGGRGGVVSMTIVNKGERDDRLTGLTSPDATVDLTGDTTLPAGSAVHLGGGTDPSASLTGMTKLAGESVELKLTFARTEPITLTTVVMPATGDYASISPTPSPTAS